MQPIDPNTLAQQVINALQAHQWQYAVVLVLIGAVVFVRWAAPKVHGPVGAYLNSQRGGTVLVLFLGVLGTMAAALAAKQKLSVSLIVGGVMTSVMASGGWNVVWDLVAPAKDPPKPPAPAIPIEGPKPPQTVEKDK